MSELLHENELIALMERRKTTIEDLSVLIKERNELSSRLSKVKISIDLKNKTLETIDKQHAAMNVVKRKNNALFDTAQIGSFNGRLDLRNKRISYDTEWLYTFLKENGKPITVKEIVMMLNERLDVPSYCGIYDSSSFSSKLGKALREDLRFTVDTMKGNNSTLYYGLKEWNTHD